MHIFTSASFSLLRADLAESSPTPSPQTTSTPSKKTPIGAIAGGAAGGAVVVIAFVIILLICLRRKKGVRRTPTTDLLGLGKGSERPVSYLPQTENDMLLRPTPVRSPSSSPPSSSSTISPPPSSGGGKQNATLMPDIGSPNYNSRNEKGFTKSLMPGTSHFSQGSSSDDSDVRNELARLRQEMHALQAQNEAPPRYEPTND